MGRIVSFFLILIVSVLLIQSQTGCANIIAPTGGPRDTLPPVLVSAIPKDSTTQFHSRSVVLSFNEYVQLDDKINDEFIVSPNPENIPFPESKLRTVTIRLKDSLKPNTTYSLDFGNAIKDVNEGNPIRHFVYVFSTGNTIDDGTISGKVTLAETGAADTTLIVVLHSNLNDSAVKKLRPEYYTRLDSGGVFHFRYLPHGTFHIYVLPNDYSKRYDDSTKLFAFYKSAVSTDSNNRDIRLYAYQQEKPVEKTQATTLAPPGKKKGEPEKLRVTTDIDNNEQDILKDLELTFNRKVTQYDSSRVILADTNFRRVTGYSLSHDTTFTKFYVHYNWPENTPFKLVLEKEAFADSTGATLSKSDTISFSTRRESQYGSVLLHFINLDLSKNPVLQLLQSDKIVKSVPLTGVEWSQRLFEPGEYELRILYDDNRNGVWDPGNFDEKRQPEIVSHIVRKLNVKGNFDNEVDINL